VTFKEFTAVQNNEAVCSTPVETVM